MDFPPNLQFCIVGKSVPGHAPLYGLHPRVQTSRRQQNFAFCSIERVATSCADNFQTKIENTFLQRTTKIMRRWRRFSVTLLSPHESQEPLTYLLGYGADIVECVPALSIRLSTPLILLLPMIAHLMPCSRQEHSLGLCADDFNLCIFYSDENVCHRPLCGPAKALGSVCVCVSVCR